MREGSGSIPGLSMPMCACVCHSLRRGRVPNVAFQPQKLRFPRFSRPHVCPQRARVRRQPKGLRGSWCSGITPAPHAKKTGFSPRPIHAHVRLRLSQFAYPWSFSLWVCCVLPMAAAPPRPGSAAAGRLTSRSNHKTRAFPGRTRLSTASTNQRSAPAAERTRKENKPLGFLSSGAVGVVASHPLRMREGPGSIPGLSMPMCACVCHSLPILGLSPFGLAASCQGRLPRRGRVPNVTFESYIESRKLSVPRAQPARTASRPARLEAALQRARTKGVRSAAAGCLTSRLSPVCSKAIGPEGAASHKSFASRAFPGRTRLSTASTNQRSAPAAERKRKEKKRRRTRKKGKKEGW